MRHALATGQWSKKVTYRDLTGRDDPLPLDPRVSEEPVDPEEMDRRIRTMAILQEHEARMAAQHRAVDRG